MESDFDLVPCEFGIVFSVSGGQDALIIFNEDLQDLEEGSSSISHILRVERLTELAQFDNVAHAKQIVGDGPWWWLHRRNPQPSSSQVSPLCP